jgi:RNA polymerase sigma-70 factor, ECF subfamily
MNLAATGGKNSTLLKSTEISLTLAQPIKVPDLVRIACDERNRAAFALLYERYKVPLGKYLVAMVSNKEIAYELYQETFIRVWVAFKDYVSIPDEIKDNFDRWLYSIAKHIAIDFIRRHKKFEFEPLPEDEPEGYNRYSLFAAASVAGHEDRVCDQVIIEKVLAAMSPQYRTCMLLQVHWGFRQREIAEMLGIREKTVSTNVKRGYRQFREIYEAMASNSNPAKGAQR